MSSGALTMMIVTQSVFVIVTTYFFIKVLRTKPKPDSGEDSEEEV